MHIAISAVTVAVAAIVVWWSLHLRRIAPQRVAGVVSVNARPTVPPALERMASAIVRFGTALRSKVAHGFSTRRQPGTMTDLADVLESLPVASVIFDEHGVIVLANAQAERVFDYRRGAL